MIKKIFIIFTFGLIIFFNGTKVQAKEKSNLDAGQISEYIEEYDCKIKVIPITEFEEDEISADYNSITYQVTTENCSLESCYIPWTIGIPYGSIITDSKTMEDKRNFEDKFKIMVPKEETEFSGKIQIVLSFKLKKEEQIREIDRFIEFDSRKSSLEIDVVDDKNNKPIKGVEIDLENCEFFTNEKYTSNDKGKIFVDRIGKGEVIIRVIELPKEYNMPEIQHMNIAYNKDEKYTIKLEHKKGNLMIDNMPNSSFAVYDMEENLIGEYFTDNKGKIEVQNLNTGEYILKQIEAAEGYEKIDDMKIEIEENLTLKIGILNKELPKEEKPTDKTEDKEELKEDIEIKPGEKPKDEVPSGSEENKKEEVVKKPEDNIQKEDNKKDETIKDKPSENKPEEKIEEDKKAGNEEAIENEETPKEIASITKPKQNQNNKNLNKLPRTGSDYFEIKLLIFDLVVCILYIFVMSLKKKRQTLKKVCQIH